MNTHDEGGNNRGGGKRGGGGRGSERGAAVPRSSKGDAKAGWSRQPSGLLGGSEPGLAAAGALAGSTMADPNSHGPDGGGNAPPAAARGTGTAAGTAGLAASQSGPTLGSPGGAPAPGSEPSGAAAVGVPNLTAATAAARAPDPFLAAASPASGAPPSSVLSSWTTEMTDALENAWQQPPPPASSSRGAVAANECQRELLRLNREFAERLLAPRASGRGQASLPSMSAYDISVQELIMEYLGNEHSIRSRFDVAAEGGDTDPKRDQGRGVGREQPRGSLASLGEPTERTDGEGALGSSATSPSEAAQGRRRRKPPAKHRGTRRSAGPSAGSKPDERKPQAMRRSSRSPARPPQPNRRRRVVSDGMTVTLLGGDERATAPVLGDRADSLVQAIRNPPAVTDSGDSSSGFTADPIPEGALLRHRPKMQPL